MASSAASLFMGWLVAQLLASSPVRVSQDTWKRFIDDIFLLWTGTPEDLDVFFKRINSFHSPVKFTIASSTDQLPFLDILISLKDGFIKTDIPTKTTDSHAYLPNSSCHSHHVVNNIPYSQVLWLRRLCADTEVFNARCDEMEGRFLRRGHHLKNVQEARARARNIPALRRCSTSPGRAPTERPSLSHTTRPSRTPTERPSLSHTTRPSRTPTERPCHTPPVQSEHQQDALRCHTPPVQAEHQQNALVTHTTRPVHRSAACSLNSTLRPTHQQENAAGAPPPSRPRGVQLQVAAFTTHAVHLAHPNGHRPWLLQVRQATVYHLHQSFGGDIYLQQLHHQGISPNPPQTYMSKFKHCVRSLLRHLSTIVKQCVPSLLQHLPTIIKHCVPSLL